MDFSSTPITFLIIGITAVISFIAFSNEQLLNKLIFYPYKINKNKSEAYRFITHGFIHANMIHLLFNMFTLYFFGRTVELYMNNYFGADKGKFVFLFFYLSAIIVSSLVSYFRQKNNSYYRSLGASGAVSAALFASILISPLSELFIVPIPIPIPAYIFGPLYLAYTVYMDKKGNDNIGHDAHFVGAIYGMILIILLVPDTFSNFIEQIITVFK